MPKWTAFFSDKADSATPGEGADALGVGYLWVKYTLEPSNITLFISYKHLSASSSTSKFKSPYFLLGTAFTSYIS